MAFAEGGTSLQCQFYFPRLPMQPHSDLLQLKPRATRAPSSRSLSSSLSFSLPLPFQPFHPPHHLTSPPPYILGTLPPILSYFDHLFHPNPGHPSILPIGHHPSDLFYRYSLPPSSPRVALSRQATLSSIEHLPSLNKRPRQLSYTTPSTTFASSLRRRRSTRLDSSTFSDTN